MKCPLRNTTTHYPDERVGIDMWDCLEAECAWWLLSERKCPIQAIGQALYSIYKHGIDVKITTGNGG